MYYPYPYSLPANTTVLDYKAGDVNGDGIIDQVYLTGQITNDSEYAENIRLLIVDGKTRLPLQITPKDASGYNAKLFLGPFSSKQRLDILVSIDTGGSGGYILAYLYTISNNLPFLLIDADRFNSKSVYSAIFKANFKVEVAAADGSSTFIIDLSGNPDMYIDAGIYNRSGRLLKPEEGGVLALGALYPLVTNYDCLYNLLAYQRIIGINNANNLGAIQTYLHWDGFKIAAERVEAGIMPIEKRA